MEPTDLKNAIVESIPPALSEDAEVACLIRKIFIFQICKQPQRLDVENLKNECFTNKTSYSSFWSVEATDFKNVILKKIHWAASEAAEV